MIERGRKVTKVEEMDVFKLSHEMALEVYKITKNFPKEEIYGLSLQMRKAAHSVPANLAEGGNRNTRAEYKYFVGVAKGSAGEVSYQLLLAKDLGYLDVERYLRLEEGYSRILQMLQRLSKSLSMMIR